MISEYQPINITEANNWDQYQYDKKILAERIEKDLGKDEGEKEE